MFRSCFVLLTLVSIGFAQGPINPRLMITTNANSEFIYLLANRTDGKGSKLVTKPILAANEFFGADGSLDPAKWLGEYRVTRRMIFDSPGDDKDSGTAIHRVMVLYLVGVAEPKRQLCLQFKNDWVMSRTKAAELYDQARREGIGQLWFPIMSADQVDQLQRFVQVGLPIWVEDTVPDE